MNLHGKDIKIFSGTSNRPLAEEIAANIGVRLGDALVGKFSDGEISVHIDEVVRGSDVFVIQSMSHPVNDNFIELLVMIDALKRASAGRITAVIPYFGYARQDRKVIARDPISAKLVANLIEIAGADRVLAMDFHTLQLQGFFDIPVDPLRGLPILAQYFKDKFDTCDDLVAVSPDVGGIGWSRKFAERLEIPLAIIDKRRPNKAKEYEIMNIVGDVKDKRVIIVDDMIDTCGTLLSAANTLMDHGAKEIFACCSHSVLSGRAADMINDSVIKEVVTLNTIDIPEEKRIGKLKILSTAHVFADAIERIYGDMSVSVLFT